MKHSFYQHLLSLFAFCAFPMLLSGQIAGTPDSTFGQGGEVVIANPIKIYYGGQSVLLPDGKVIVAAEEYDDNNDIISFVFTRLLPDGSLDLSYSLDGQAHLDITEEGSEEIGDIALTADGKLIVAGTISVDDIGMAFVARLNSDGELDESFGQDGVAIFDVGDDEDSFFTVLIKPDGNLLLGGLTYDSGNAGIYDFLLVQLLPDGTPDSAFGTAGIATADFADGLEAILSLALQADGKIIAAGSNQVSGYDMEIVRFNPDGTIDQSFGTNGAFLFGLVLREDVAYAVAVQDDQKIVFCGASFRNDNATGEIALFRLLPTGNFDPAFGTNGQVLTNLGFLEFARTLVLQPDGKIVVGAESSESNLNFDQSRFWVLRYNTDGSLDATFGEGGKVKTPIYGEATETSALLLQPDGKIIHTGTSDDEIVLWRYLNDIIVGTEETPTVDFQLHCSPNPVADNADLTWTLPESGEVRCDLYDVQGRLIQTIIPPTFLLAGAHRQSIHFGSNIPVGTQFVVFSVGNKRQILSVIRK